MAPIGIRQITSPTPWSGNGFFTLFAIMNRNFKRSFSMTGAISQDRKRCQFLLLDEKVLDKKPTIVPALAKRDYYLAGLQTNIEKKSIAIIINN